MLRSNRLGWIIMISHDNPALKFIGSVVTQVMIPGANFTICATPQDAIALLRRHDANVKLNEDMLV